MRSTIEIHHKGLWLPAAEFSPLSAVAHAATFEYLPEYVYADESLPALSLNLPVSDERLGYFEEQAPLCPSSLIDLVPHGRGRKFLLNHLGLKAREDAADLLLAQYGAFNPIGNLRINTAVSFYEKHRKEHPGIRTGGFTFEEITRPDGSFAEYVWQHLMLAAGATGVQGAAPKFMLTQSKDGLWHADAALPDEEAQKHWLVKFARGTDESDQKVLRNEAAYLRVAARCGLRCAGEPILAGNMLFVPRFDRQVLPDGLRRLHQETLASLAGLRDSGLRTSQFDLVNAFIPHVTHPAQEVAEFIRRDILNLAMRNPDNHARNTSVQILPDGTVQLTPFYDFAPMYLDKDLITRGCRWALPGKNEMTDWGDIVGALQIDDSDKRQVMVSLRSFYGMIHQLPETMLACGVDRQIIDDCEQGIEQQMTRLARIRPI
ncbi:serine/threonine-protein kinase HipA [Formivibrio citricus]|uniref:Serine/threonine-protein kinase HipA n=1 Tax=Formivibrio citricus TaxID=83765 RepID=A0A1I4ZDB1_9NEIS|nr:HipA domain-containing protein [Formivibrio citricus]SFN48282.1 serine/threonine-protein kinase HipA [Formivibrio citricus]